MSHLPLIQVITPEVPCGVTWDRYRQQSPMSSELINLLKEVEQLRRETDGLVCNCTRPDCPFTGHGHGSGGSGGKSSGSLSSLNSLSYSLSSEEDDRLILRRQWSPPARLTSYHSKSTGNLSCIVPGVQRRADGTIVEGDGPRYSLGQARKMRRCGTYNGFTQATHLNIANCIIMEAEDCKVDYENTFSSEGYKFSRQAPERKQFRSPKIQKKHSMLKNSSSYPITASERSLKTAVAASPDLSLKSDDVAENEHIEQRGRSSSSPSVATGSRHMSLDQTSQMWKAATHFQDKLR